MRQRTAKGAFGRGTSAQGATTRYLTRIITYLSEVKTRAGISDIGKACVGGSGSRAIRDAIQWLVSNKIIIVAKGSAKDNTGHSRKYYSMNPKFEELRNEI